MGIVGRGVQRVNDFPEAPPRAPQYHGDKNDPRYPSPRELRGNTAAFFDIALHAGLAGAVANTAVSGLGWVVLIFMVTYAVLSFVHTVIVQRIIHATIGKALLGLVVIRGEDGRWPTFGNLVRGYFWRGFATAFCFFDDNDLPDYDLHEPARVTVQRPDVRALRSGSAQPQIDPRAYPGYGPPPNAYPVYGPAPANPPRSHKPIPHPAGAQQYPPQYPPNPAASNGYQPQPDSGPAYSPNYIPPQGYRPHDNQPPHHFPPHPR
ncbi:hypothetical protein ACIHDR_30650 [Nocardia sp. NPDC052278]|uniref:hypothetical protein n=1 Tax=unclassified Nocardia TaxID=2637762 RepID=UPI0036BF076E